MDFKRCAVAVLLTIVGTIKYVLVFIRLNGNEAVKLRYDFILVVIEWRKLGKRLLCISLYISLKHTKSQTKFKFLRLLFLYAFAISLEKGQVYRFDYRLNSAFYSPEEKSDRSKEWTNKRQKMKQLRWYQNGVCG